MTDRAEELKPDIEVICKKALYVANKLEQFVYAENGRADPDDNVRFTCNELRLIVNAALTRPPDTGCVVPEGWKLVPVEPTEVQVQAGVYADDLRTGFEAVRHIYRAMLTAAPQSAQKERE